MQSCLPKGPKALIQNDGISEPQGDTRGDAIHTIKFVEWEDTPKLTVKDKAALFGRQRVEVGGPTIGLPEGEKPHERKPTDYEPAFYHIMSKEYHQEINHIVDPIACLDFTPDIGCAEGETIFENNPHHSFAIGRCTCFDASSVGVASDGLPPFHKALRTYPIRFFLFPPLLLLGGVCSEMQAVFEHTEPPA